VTPRVVALATISAIVGLGSLLAFYAKSRHKMDLEQWTVAGRGFGVVLVWLLMAGEQYTTFTFLGASGWAYSKGGPALYILAYQPLVFVVCFYVLPTVCEIGRKYRLQTQADFFQLRYGSKHLSALVALVGVVSLLPYCQVQLMGLGLIVEAASYGGIPRAWAMVCAFALVAAFVFVSGIRGIAWVSIIKDVLLLGAAVFVGIAVPYIYFGGIGAMFAALAHARPNHLTLPGSTTDLGHAWYVSSVLLTSVGFYMWPQFFAASYTARSGDVVRRNAVVMPLYGISMPLMFIVGFAALLVLPRLSDSNMAMLSIVRRTFPAWFVGVVGGAGALTAMVPAAIQLLTGATLFSKNLYRPIVAPGMSDGQVAQLAKIMVLVLTTGALLLSMHSSATLVSLLLLGYAGVAQLFPGVVLGLFSSRVTTPGVLAGLGIGIATTLALMLTGRDPYHGLNAGFIALCLNFAASAAVSALTSARAGGFEEMAAATAVPDADSAAAS
jgi:SSS family solute:Na+ symporter